MSKVYFLYIQYTYHARLQSLFAHNHAALKSHKVHDRVLHWEITVCVLPLRAAIYFIILLPPPFCVRIIKFIVPPVLFDDTLLFIPPCLLWTLCWLGCFSLFFFGFVVALVLCVKPAPEQQRLDDAIGFLRDHAEVRTAEFQFFFNHPSHFRSLLFSVFFYACLRHETNAKTCVHCTFCWLRFRLIMIIYCNEVFIVHNV